MRSQTTMKNLRALIGATALLSLVGCSTTQTAAKADGTARGSSRTADQGGGQSGEGKAPEIKISNRAMMLFDEALRFWDVQRRSRTPEYESAERKFEAALAADDRLAEADYNLGVIAERQGKLDAAAAHYRDALRKKPSLRAAAENLAVLAQNRGDTQSALGAYGEISRQFQDDGASRGRMAEIYRQAGDDEKAVQLAREALMRDPKAPGAQKTMMMAYYDKKQPAMARLWALRALKVDEGDPEIYHTLGLILLDEHEEEKALVQFNKAASVRGDYLPSQVMLAKIALKNQDYTGAEAHLKRILQSDPKNAEIHLDLGVVYKGMGQIDRAMQEYDTAEKLNPNLAGIYLNKGIILHRLKDAPEKGLEYYKKYIALKGGDVGLPADAPVFGLMKEAEQIIQAKADASRQEQEQKKQIEEQKKQELLKKEQQGQAKQAAAGKGEGKAAPKAEKPAGKAAPRMEADVEPATARAPAPAPAAPSPGKQAPDEGKAKDEPTDGL